MAGIESTSTSFIIPLEHMPQQVHIWTRDDDWTGVIDRKERRKLQNRQNQRKYRNRRKATKIQSSPTTSPPKSSELTSTTSDMDLLHLAARASSSSSSSSMQEGNLNCDHAPPYALEFLRLFEATARHSYLSNSPKVEHLLGLTRLNVHFAITENIRAIGMDDEWMKCDDSISIFNLPQAGFSENSIPPSLRPTETQRTNPHHPWLDFFPFPKMRDCLIMAAELFDDDELCHDLMAFWDTRNTGATLVVWGQSWDPRNWEVTEGFARKWGWLLRGSHELLVSTNYWRRRRGEAPLVWREILAQEWSTISY